jgi:hypothetical protein
MKDTTKTLCDLPLITDNDKKFLRKYVYLKIEDGLYKMNLINEKSINQKDLKTLYITKSYPTDQVMDTFVELFNIRDNIYGKNKNFFHGATAASCLSRTQREHCINEEIIESILVLIPFPPGKNLFDYDQVFIPLHDSFPIEHWTLGVIDIKNKKIYHYNSAPHEENDREHLLTLSLYVKTVLNTMSNQSLKDVMKVDTWPTISSDINIDHGPIPEQDMTHPDCLLFVVLFMEALAYNHNFNHISQDLIINEMLRSRTTNLILAYDSKYWHKVIVEDIGTYQYT